MNSIEPDPSALPIIVLTGPTGVGKTELAIQLAALLDAEIINADSMQVYRTMDIGTAKPTLEQRACVPHHLLDVVFPDEAFDAGLYLRHAQPVIKELQQRGKIPLVVGGTGLYLKALAHGICKAAPGDAGTRHQLQLELQEHGLALLHRELQKVDPDLASRVQPQDRQRILRALEVFRSTGQPLSKWQAQHGFRSIRYRTIKIFLNRPREELYARIDQRVEAMMVQGFLDEVRSLLERGYGPELKSMQALGYRHLAAYLAGKLALNDAVEGIRRDTRRYAKRQLTWFRADPEYAWLAADQAEEVVRFVDHALADIRPSAAG